MVKISKDFSLRLTWHCSPCKTPEKKHFYAKSRKNPDRKKYPYAEEQIHLRPSKLPLFTKKLIPIGIPLPTSIFLMLCTHCFSGLLRWLIGLLYIVCYMYT